jgi:hypothetical protein
MTKLHAHFDGRVLIPDEPVDLPQGRTLELEVREVTPRMEKGMVENKLPTFRVDPGAKIIRTEDVLRAEDEL